MFQYLLLFFHGLYKRVPFWKQRNQRFIFPRFHNDPVGHVHILQGKNVEHVPNNTSMIAVLLITR